MSRPRRRKTSGVFISSSTNKDARRLFIYARRVQFAETDAAGIVHFANYLKYLEEAEHAMWRAAGLRIAEPGAPIGFPRVAASVEYRAPLHFEEEIDVHVRVDKLGPRSITYSCSIVRGTVVAATGTWTAVCVDATRKPMKSIEIPKSITSGLSRFKV